MAKLEILYYPHPTLRETCQPVETIDSKILQLLDDMAETMYAAKGVGLAAPQIGATKRVLVIDTEEQRGRGLVEMINPYIVSHSLDKSKHDEGCLSFPELYAPVERYNSVVVEALSRQGETFRIEATGLLSIAVQHEIDHLNGILFLDHVGKMKQSMIKRRMQKWIKKAR